MSEPSLRAGNGQTEPGRPRSIALVGPYGSGKSALFDELLSAAGAAARHAAESRGHTMSTELRLGHCTYLGDRWSILDCPGSVEFTAAEAAALAVADLAVVVCEPTPSRALAVAPLLKALDEAQLPHLIFVNKMDTQDASVRDTLAALQAHSRQPLVLRQVPIREDGRVTGYADVVSERAYRYREGKASELVRLPSHVEAQEQEARDALVEVLADRDDALLEQVVEGVVPSSEQLFGRVRADQAAGAIVEVLFGAAEHGNGIRRLWKALRHDVPDAAETAARRGISAEGEALAQVFKTVQAGHTGRLSYARIWRGTIKDGMTLNGARIGGVFRMTAGEPTRVQEAGAGELVVFSRLERAVTGDVLSASGSAPPLPFPHAPPPVYGLAIAPEDRKDDVKLSGALQKLADEDPSLPIETSPETGETVLRGQGEIHLKAAMERLARAYGLRVKTTRPRVPFKETIRHAVHQHTRLKRQTGGHGQFADVKLDIAPRGRGEGFLFVDRIVGGAVPRQYIPAVADAAETACQKGPLGHPVVDVAVTLVDGGFHSVDSSDMAFKGATRTAMMEGLAKADPVLLEPIDHVTITVPNSYTANAQRLLTTRGGRILGFSEKGEWSGWDEVEALVPAAELHDLIIELRSQTMGLGTYRCRFDHLAESRRSPADSG